MPRKLARRATPASEPEPPEEILEEPEPPSDAWKPTPLLYDVGDACFILGKISKQMLYRLIHLDQIHPVKVGTRSMFTMEEMERFVIERAKETELATTQPE